MNNLSKNDANVWQTLNMCYALANFCDLTFLSTNVSKKVFNQKLKDFGISQNFRHIKFWSLLIGNNKYIELFFRLIFQFQSYLHVILNKYDFIYTRDFSFLYFVSLLPKTLRPKTKIIFETHKVYHLSSKKVSFEQEKKALSVADFTISITDGIKQDLKDKFQIKNIKTLPDGVNLDFFQKIEAEKDLKQKYGIKENEKIVIYTWSFKDWKWVDTLIHSAKFVQHDNVKILIVGGKDKEIAEKQKMAKRLWISDKIIFQWFLPQREIVKLLKISNIWVIPNNKTLIWEKYTSPLKVFEYMACWLPIIASNLPSMKEVLKQNQNALFFESENPQELAHKINYLIKNEYLMQSMWKNNKDIINQYSWQSRAQKIFDIIKKL